MKAYNKRLNHITDVKAIDFVAKKVKLSKPNSNPIFIYNENLDNIELLEFTGVTLDGEDVYVKDVVTDGFKKYTVSKKPGGYYPFIQPVRINFKKVK
jgi:hypothetical protein